jgi:hypothetical protein
MPRKSKNRKNGIILPLLLTFLILTFMALSLIEEFQKEKYVEADVLRVVGNTIIIGNGCKAIVADTSPERAENIRLGMEKIIPERPTTHDTIAQILKSFNITLERVVLERFDGRFYYAFAYLHSKDKVLKLDLMPSDGIAIALRLNAPIYINKTMLDKVGKNIC